MTVGCSTVAAAAIPVADWTEWAMCSSAELFPSMVAMPVQATSIYKHVQGLAANALELCAVYIKGLWKEHLTANV